MQGVAKQKQTEQHSWRDIYLATFPFKWIPSPPRPPALILTGEAKKQRWLDFDFPLTCFIRPLFNIKAGGRGGVTHFKGKVAKYLFLQP